MSDTAQGAGWWMATDGKWYPPPEAVPPKRQRKILGLVILAVIICGAIVFALNHKDRDTDISLPKSHTVLYKVEGTASQADITFATATGGTSQQQKVDVPLRKKSDRSEGIQQTFSGGSFLYISAQNPNDDGATITCIIEEDGIELARNTSHGSFTIASCSAHA